MASSTPITTIIDLGNRAFSNLYDVEINISKSDNNIPLYTAISPLLTPPPPPGVSSTAPISVSKDGAVENVTYDGIYSLGAYWSEALQASYPNKPRRIKGVTLSFRETGDFFYLRMINTWLDTVYDREKNVFKKGDPRGTITISVDNPNGKGKTYFKHFGCIPETVTQPQLAYNNSDPLLTVVKFTAEDLFIYYVGE